MQIEGFTEKVTCPICQSKDYVVIQKDRYPTDLTREELLKVYQSSSDHQLIDQLVSCKSCSLVYLNPRVNSNLIIESYSNAVDPVFVQQNVNRIKTFSENFSRICKSINITPSKSKKVLDVGCAGGAFPKAAADLGFDVVGVEPSKWMVNFSKETYGLDIRQGTLQEQNFKGESFDIITLWDVIEHISEPEKVLVEIRKILKNDGYLIINYPDYDSFARKIFQMKWPFFLSVHLFYFSPETITRLLNNAEFEVTVIRPFWQTLGLGYIIKRASAYFGIFKVFQKLCTLLKMDNIPFTYNIGQTLVVAQKRK